MRTLASLSLLVGLCSCASGQRWGHQSEDTSAYRDHAVGPNKYLVGYRGNSWTTKDEAEKNAIESAQRVCSNHGFKSFDMISKTDLSAQTTGEAKVVCAKLGYSTVCKDKGSQTSLTPDIELLVTCIN